MGSGIDYAQNLGGNNFDVHNMNWLRHDVEQGSRLNQIRENLEKFGIISTLIVS